MHRSILAVEGWRDGLSVNASELSPPSESLGFFTRPVAVGALVNLPPEPNPKRPPSLPCLLTGSDFLSEFYFRGYLFGEVMPLVSNCDFVRVVI